jgi:osmoprotectant transport system permease protein
MKREDGWDKLKEKYELGMKPLALEHGLAYEALRNGKIAVTDAYSTDGEIRKYNLLLLKDDLSFFPDYYAVSFYGASLPPKARAVIEKLKGIVSEHEMQQLNAKALFEKEDHRLIAHNFLLSKKLIRPSAKLTDSPTQDLLNKTAEHLLLTLVALLASVAVALPLGVFIYYKPRFANIILYATGMLQTIPSIALLALMIPIFGIGKLPAIIALFLYALLPILRNTITGLRNVEASYKSVASAMGLNVWQRLWLVEIPLAKPTILAGIRTAAVINVGTATLAAFIGAGGLGDFIVTGLALNNTELILRGAVPSAMLAIGVELTFEFVDRALVPSHLRQRVHK